MSELSNKIEKFLSENEKSKKEVELTEEQEIKMIKDALGLSDDDTIVEKRVVDDLLDKHSGYGASEETRKKIVDDIKNKIAKLNIEAIVMVVDRTKVQVEMSSPKATAHKEGITFKSGNAVIDIDNEDIENLQVKNKDSFILIIGNGGVVMQIDFKRGFLSRFFDSFSEK
jgi:hypothetical protein